jgi:hypothetical protein
MGRESTHASHEPQHPSSVWVEVIRYLQKRKTGAPAVTTSVGSLAAGSFAGGLSLSLGLRPQYSPK